MSDATGLKQTMRTVRLDDARVQRVLDALDSTAAQFGNRRGAPRFPYRIKGLSVSMKQPGSSAPVVFLVPTRDISATGLSFLHGGFVHIGTRCSVQLITMHGTWNEVPAAVRRCQYVEGGVHEVAVRFDREIDPSAYSPAAIRAKVLVVDDDEVMVKLCSLYLQQLNAWSDVARNGDEAIKAALADSYDLILMDLEMPVKSGAEAVAELRAQGYSRPIAAVTGLTSDEDRARCLKSGFDFFIPKPFHRADLGKLLEALREEPIFSTLEADPAMSELINSFIAGLGSATRAMEAALVKKDAKALVAVVRSLKGQAGGYGFEPLSEVAAVIENTLLREHATENVSREVLRLVKMCNQARPMNRQTEGTSSDGGAVPETKEQ